jgi:hypothetical protein
LDGIDQEGDHFGGRHQLGAHVELLGEQHVYLEAHAGDIAARTAEARDQTIPDRIASEIEQDGNSGCRLLGRERSR